MALKNQLDAAAVQEALRAWLPTAVDGITDVEIDDVVVPQASGMSSETVLLTARWKDAAGTRVEQGLVARVAPEAGLFPTYDLAREARVMRALAEHTDAAVPRVVAHETTGDVLGGPFLLVERVYGDVPADDPPFTMDGWVLGLTPEQQRALHLNAADTIGRIHRVTAADLGLLDLGEHGVDHWREFYAWTAGDKRSPTIDAAFAWLDEHKPKDDGRRVVVWGDARLGNFMFGPDQQVTGAFDWEMACVGRPEVDLGYFLFCDRVWSSGMGVSLPPGFAERTEVIAAYEAASGQAVHDLDWFEAFAGVRCAILLMRVGKLMIEHGLMPPEAPMPLVNPASVSLATLLGLDLPTGEAAWITGSR